MAPAPDQGPDKVALRLIRQSGVHAAEIARRCHISPAALSRYLHGSRPRPPNFRRAIRQAIADALEAERDA